MKYAFTLAAALMVNWLLWSGHFDNPFLIGMGALSCLISVLISKRMGIVDEEGAPVQLGFRPFFQYAPWLAYRIIESNVAMAKIILSPSMPLNRSLIRVAAHQGGEIGRVIMANSITLTPGTVSVKFEGDEILVHSILADECAEDLTGDMDRRICRLEKRS